MVELEPHEFELQLAVVSGTLALFNGKINATLGFGLDSVPCRKTCCESNHLRSVDPIATKFSALDIEFLSRHAASHRTYRPVLVIVSETVCRVDPDGVVFRFAFVTRLHVWF